MEKQIIYSDTLSKFSETFSLSHFQDSISREKFKKRPKKIKDKIPYFLCDTHAHHEQDVVNIKETCRIKKIKQEDLEIIVFDSHTDMYQKGERYNEIEKKVDMANWIIYFLDKGYNLTLVGVTDFTFSAPQREGFEYSLFSEKLSFFTGHDYNPTRDFKENDGTVKLSTFKEFFNHPLKENTFISLDSDVSSDFTSMTPKYAGRLGACTINELENMISYIKQNSALIGFSFFGCGFLEAFNQKSDRLLKIINL